MLVTNTDSTKVLHPVTPGAHCLFNRVRIHVSGALCENIENFARVQEYYERLLPPSKREDLANLAFGVASGDFATGNAVAETIAANNGKQIIIFQPSSLGLVNQPKMIPMWAFASGGWFIWPMRAGELSVGAIATPVQTASCRLLANGRFPREHSIT